MEGEVGRSWEDWGVNSSQGILCADKELLSIKEKQKKEKKV